MGLFFNEMVGLVRVEGVDTAGGAADSSASLRNGNARGGWLDFTFPPIAKARWMGHPRRGWRMEEQQIPPLRYGMEMQGAAGWILRSHPSQKRDGWGTPGVGGGWRSSRFLRFATEWKCKERLVGFCIPTHRKSAMDGAPGETRIPFGNDNKKWDAGVQRTIWKVRPQRAKLVSRSSVPGWRPRGVAASAVAASGSGSSAASRREK